MLGVDGAVRLRAFEWLKEQEDIHGDVLPRTLLERGFDFKGERIPLLGPSGIFKPRHLDLPLSMTTAPKGPYDDSFSNDGYLLYRYRGTDLFHRDNVGLRQAMKGSTPLIYFHGVAPGRYLATWPVYIVGDNLELLTFKVAVDDATMGLVEDRPAVAEAADIRRAYVTAIVRQRLHQRSFRERVLRAYREQCALCRLRHYELLDAAHIIPDPEPEGIPSVRNGIALCKFHHAAFDSLLLGITPDYAIEIRNDVLKEEDGPMLQYALKELHGARMLLPRNRELWPNQGALDLRYQRFKLAS
jgi:putative restriction endonuclease